MRVALIDHHDSFTAILADGIGRACGRAPDVFGHDAVGWAELAAGGYALIVVSAGPGRADRPQDVGVSAAVIEAWAGPLLGVCLGHQAMCLSAGGALAPARAPAHGVVTPIRHEAAGLFEGLPQTLGVARYHSWIVSDPGADMTVTARAADGTIMAVADRARPRWGVQFHPESIGTQAGAALMANVARLTRAHWARGGAIAVGCGAVSAKAPRAAARDQAASAAPRSGCASRTASAAGSAAPMTLLARRLGAWRAPEAVFRALYGDAAPAFWLDSAGAGATEGATEGAGRAPAAGRWSFLGDARGPYAQHWRYSVAANAARIVTRDGVAALRRGDAFSLLSEAVARRRITPAARAALGPDAPPFLGGCVGAFGYGLAAQAPDAPRPPWPRPRGAATDADVIMADRVLAFDHHRREVWLLALDDQAGRAEAWIAETAARLRALDAGPPPSLAPPRWRFRPRTSRAAYARAIAAAQAEIRAGESYEVCLTTEFVAEAPAGCDLLAAYGAIRRANPAPYAAFLRFGEDRGVLCASPERFLRIDPDGAMEAKPIKGTAPRGRDAAEDAAIAQALGADAKIQAENLMIVDVLRNDLARSAVLGSVHAPALFAVERHPHVHQLVSTVRAQMRADVAPLEAVRAAFPGGSMTGAPKPRTMAMIDALEARPRGFYAGALGYVGVDGAVDLNIVIRSLEVGGGRARLGVGGAILAASDVEQECDEVWWKAAGVLAGLGAAQEARALWRGGDRREAM